VSLSDGRNTSRDVGQELEISDDESELEGDVCQTKYEADELPDSGVTP
jgi:hypothetical protein